MWGWHDQSGWSVVLMMLGMLGFWGLVGWMVMSVVRGPRPAPRASIEVERVVAETFGTQRDDCARRTPQFIPRLGTLNTPTAGVRRLPRVGEVGSHLARSP